MSEQGNLLIFKDSKQWFLLLLHKTENCGVIDHKYICASD